MENVKKIVGINLLILLVYMLAINVPSTEHKDGLAVVLLSAFAIGAHTGINFLIAIVLFIKKEPNAKLYLLSSGLVLVIGFSSCWGSMML